MNSCGNEKFLNWDQGPITTLEAGRMVEFDIRVTAHHKGHFMFRLCDQPLSSATGGLQAEETCLNEHVLQRVRPMDIHSDCSPNDVRGDCQPIDEANPGYWYLPPKGNAEQSTGASPLNAPGVPYKFHYWIPQSFTCEKCTLQWWWLSANSCTPHPDAYNCYFQNMTKQGWNAQEWCSGICSFSGTCPPTQGGPINCGEQFKNCADVRVVGDSGPTPQPSPAPPTPAPQLVPTAVPTPTPVIVSTPVPSPTPVIVPTPVPTPTPVVVPTPVPTVGPEPTPGPVHGLCTDLTMEGSWAPYSCSNFESPGKEYCAHQELNSACCFCGGGLLGTVAPTPAPGPCTNLAMNGIWVHYSCSAIEPLGKEYCAHQEVNLACCFCGGGQSQLTPEVPTPEPEPESTASPTPSPTPALLTTAPTPVPSPKPPSSNCVSQSVLVCMNDASTFWPKCDPSQSKDTVGPNGYEYGHYCTQKWADALNEMLSDPLVDKCGNVEATRKLLAQVAYETAYFSTVYQPRDGGAGLIHMIPGNWVRNALDMDRLWPGQDYAPKAEAMGKSFFQTPAYGWRSVAAWFKRTNEVIPNCGIDLFDQPFETQTRCILSRVVSRQEAYDIAGTCLSRAPTPAPTLSSRAFLSPTNATETEKSGTTMMEPFYWSRLVIVLSTALSVLIVHG